MNTRRSSLGYGAKPSGHAAAQDSTSAALAELRKGVHVPSMERAPQEFIKQACENMKQEVPGAEILQYTDQGGLKIPEEAREGVCSAMTAEWIRLGAQNSQADASKAFGSVLQNDVGKLANAQVAEMRHGDQIKQKNNAIMAQADDIQGAADDAKSMMALQKDMNKQLRRNDKFLEHADKEMRAGQPMRAGVDTLSLRKEVLLKNQKAALRQEAGAINAALPGAVSQLQQKQAALNVETDQFRTARGGGLPGTQVHDFKEFANGFTDHVKTNTAANGFYRIGLKGPDGGHVIGLHKTDGECRLMDANTAEWKTKNHNDMCELLTAHVNEMYLDRNYTHFDITQYKHP
ncbi:hypothetical protein D187_009545 [Cystobacter fuscus DSM 2262]|uniref:Peptidase C58 YopT-type domain-containing protein n=2 Tax=Cystobacter fuscus TaxID=43 RepID=S9Q198_CYSF2|nr:hypothetical protein D187_009545 [Cystobacter fuscus DSM 2262]